MEEPGSEGALDIREEAEQRDGDEESELEETYEAEEAEEKNRERKEGGGERGEPDTAVGDSDGVAAAVVVTVEACDGDAGASLLGRASAGGETGGNSNNRRPW